MKHWKLSKWCNQAVGKIYYPPDRDAVFQELYQHVDDRSDSFLAQGMTEEEAIEKTLQVMGDAAELRKYLGAIHRPFWGFAYSIAKWLCTTAAILFALAFSLQTYNSIVKQYYTAPSHNITSLFHPYEDTAYGEKQRIFYEEPGTKFHDSGYTVTLSKVSAWVNDNDFFFLLNITNPLPWANRPHFTYRITALDSLGNYYTFRQAQNAAENKDTAVCGSLYQTAPFFWVFDGHLLGCDPEKADWIELRYDWDGRDMVFRIDLTGGADK